MRLLIATDAWHPQPNGVVRVLDTLIARLTAQGHRIQVVSPDQFATIPCPTYAEIPLALSPGRKVGEILDSFRPDAIHIATEGPLGWATRSHCLKRQLPFTTAYHTKFPQYIRARTGLPLNLLYKAVHHFHGRARHVLAPSPSVYRELTAQGFANVAHWSHGVDTARFSPRDRDIFAHLPRPIFLYVGRVTVDKNLPAFLDLDLPGSKVVVGSGPLRNRLKRLYPKTLFHIAQGDDELSRCYSAGDVFVFPSRTDTYGLVMLEAMACGVPVAAYPVAGPLDVFEADGPGDYAHGCLNEDLGLAARQALGKSAQACQAHARNHSWDHAIDQFLGYLAPISAKSWST
ncbi:glycosyltransferase family 1 protein [Magnetospira thiophila]